MGCSDASRLPDEALGGHIRKGERGVTVCYADRFTPKNARGGDGGAADVSSGADVCASSGGGDEVRQVAFLKRFTVFNGAQCDDLPGHLYEAEGTEQRADLVTIPEAEALIAASGANLSIGAPHACYMPRADRIEVPLQAAFIDPINYYRTVLHELGHNAVSRIMPNGMRRSRELAGFSSRAFGIIPEVLLALPMRPLRCHASTPCGKLPVLRALKFLYFGCAWQGRKLMREGHALFAKIMPHGDLRNPGDPASLRLSRGIIWDAALWVLCRYRHNGHWTGHSSRLDRDQTGRFGTVSYGREELVAEMCSAFTCAALGIVPTVRHADYIACWLEVLKGDNRAIFRAASQASKAADFLLAFRSGADAVVDAGEVA